MEDLSMIEVEYDPTHVWVTLKVAGPHIKVESSNKLWMTIEGAQALYSKLGEALLQYQKEQRT